MGADPHDLARFVDAQRPVIDDVMAELRHGEKRTPWMWFVFPQVVGLGQSPMSRQHAIRSLDEARAYLAHPVLGARLAECTQLTLRHSGRTAVAIFGPDAKKFHSSMTLFRLAGGTPSVFADALEAFFDGHPDRATLNRLGWIIVSVGSDQARTTDPARCVTDSTALEAVTDARPHGARDRRTRSRRSGS